MHHAHDKQDDQIWKDSVFDALRICIPECIPLFTSIYASNENYWRESTNLLRRLSLLESEMGGGAVEVLRIGWKLLFVIGSLGGAIISKTKQLEFAWLWSNLKIPCGRSDYEITWREYSEINYWANGITGENRDPFPYVGLLSESTDLSGIFGDLDILSKSEIGRIGSEGAVHDRRVAAGISHTAAVAVRGCVGSEAAIGDGREAEVIIHPAAVAA